MDELDAMTLILLADLDRLPKEYAQVRELWLRTLGLIALEKLTQQAKASQAGSRLLIH